VKSRADEVKILNVFGRKITVAFNVEYIDLDTAQHGYSSPVFRFNFAGGSHFSGQYAEVHGHSRGLAMIAEIRWPGLPNRVYLRVIARGKTRDRRLILSIQPDEEFKREFLVRNACGISGQAFNRRDRRFCVRIPVEWRTFGTRAMHPGEAEDLSAGGMSISAKMWDVQVGNRIVINVPVAETGLTVTGTVLHLQRRRVEGGMVLGIQFENREGGEQKILRRLLRSCAAYGVLAVEA